MGLEGFGSKVIKNTEIKISDNKDIVFSVVDENAYCSDFHVKIDLENRKQYFGSVKVSFTDESFNEEQSFFITGKNSEKWVGKWILSKLDKNTQHILQKKFSINENSNLENEIKRLYICALGIYEVYINNKKVGDEFLAPGYHSYDFIYK